MPVLRLTLMIAAVLFAGCVTHGEPACKAKCEPSLVANDPLNREPSRAAPTPAEINTAEPSRAETKSEEPLAVVDVQPAKPASAKQAPPGEQAEQAKSAVAIAPAKSTQTEPSKVSPKPSGSAAATPAGTTAAPVTPGAKVATAGNKVDAIDSKPQTPASKPAATSVPAMASADQSKAKVVPPPAPAAKPEAAALDLAALEKQLKETKAIGVFTKLTLKNQVDDLLGRFRAYYGGQLKTTLSELRQPYDLLMLKVITLLQNDDPALARAINGSREAIWGILADPVRFSKY